LVTCSKAPPTARTPPWLDKLTEVDRKRARYQEMAADDLITFDELRARLAELDDTRTIAKRELRALQSHRERVVELESDRDALLDSLVNVAPDALASLAANERHHVYRTLRLRVVAHQDGSLELSGMFGESLAMCQSRTLRANLSGRAGSDPGASLKSPKSP
jgi:glutamate synthase domain-containing protein 3